MRLWEADKQFLFCVSQRLCFLKVLFQRQERTENVIGLITAYINAIFPLIGFAGLKVFQELKLT